MLHSSPIVHMDHTEPIFKDLLLYCTKKVAKNHNYFFYFRHGGETHFLVLPQTLIYPIIVPLQIFCLTFWNFEIWRLAITPLSKSSFETLLITLTTLHKTNKIPFNTLYNYIFSSTLKTLYIILETLLRAITPT